MAAPVIVVMLGISNQTFKGSIGSPSRRIVKSNRDVLINYALNDFGPFVLFFGLLFNM